MESLEAEKEERRNHRGILRTADRKVLLRKDNAPCLLRRPIAMEDLFKTASRGHRLQDLRATVTFPRLCAE